MPKPLTAGSLQVDAGPSSLAGTETTSNQYDPSQPLPVVPDYQLLCRIGGGSYGEVWLARSATGVLRALKIVWRHTFEDDRPFQREFEGIRRFERISREHLSQLALYHVGRGEGYFYYVMELADDSSAECAVRSEESAEEKEKRRKGEKGPIPSAPFPLFSPANYTPHTLRSDLKTRGRLPVAQVLELGLALTEALAHLHGHGLVHRDIKPSNIIFVNGRPKLADIGLVTDAGDARSIVGTEGYLAPEGPGTPQADIFALGKVLYEAATGMDRREFPQLPPNLREWPDAKLIFELNEIFLRACAANARERYANAEAMHAELALLQIAKSVKRQRAWERHLSYAKKGAWAVSMLAVASAIVWSLPAWKSRSPAVEWSKNPAANEAYRNGLLAFHTGSAKAVSQAAQYFEKAVELDPTFAEAYAHLAHAYNWMGPDDPKMIKRARLMAEKALSLNTACDSAQRIVSWSKGLLEHDWAGAEKACELAIKLNANSEANWYGYANVLVSEGKTNEAVQLVERALRLDPRSVAYLKNAGSVYLAAHQYERAIQKYEQVIEKEPSSLLHIAGLLATAWRETGEYSKAIQVEEQAALLKGTNTEQAKYDTLREAYARGGQTAYWRQLLEWSKDDEKNPVLLAGLYARIGDKDKAFHYLDRAYEETPTQLTFQINREPSFDSLRTDRQFAELLKKLRLVKR